MTGEATDLVILLKGVATIDHARGCQGREYACSCGWDEEREQYAAQAATLIEAQAAEIEGLRRALEPFSHYAEHADIWPDGDGFFGETYVKGIRHAIGWSALREARRAFLASRTERADG